MIRADGQSAFKPCSQRLDKAIAEVSSVNPFVGRTVPDVEVPQRPKITSRMPMDAQLKALQKYISQFQYNFLPRTFFNCYKYRPLCRILDTAREVVKEALPIRCLEATYLAIYLTQGVKEVDRYPLTFKTVFHGQVCRHIVLAVKHDKNCWGSLGLSRKEDLMYKKLAPMQLSDLVKDYQAAYEGHGHEVVTVKVGLPVSHSSTSAVVPCWRFLSLNYRTMSADGVYEALDKFSAMASRLAAEWERNPMHVQAKKRTFRKKRAKSLSLPKDAGGEPLALSLSDDSTGGGMCPEAASSASESDEGLNELEDSDEAEENDERIRSILANRSPFRRNQYNTPIGHLYARGDAIPTTPAKPKRPAEPLSPASASSPPKLA